MIALLLAALLAAAPTVNPGKAAGVYYVYDYKAEPAMTPAPEGYEPFYISHFARHGARYCTGQQDSLAVWLSKAEKAGVLTEFGAAFKERYDVAYESLRMRAGTLTEIGQDQHRTIARHMFSRFPEVFEGPTRAEAASTESGRVIMSMWSFLSSLQTLDDSLDITAEASSRFAPWLQPTHKLSPYFIKINGGLGEYDRKAEKQFFSTTVPWKAITGRLFTSPDVVTEVLHSRPDKFIRALHSVVSDTECTGDDPSVYDGLFTPEEFTAVGRYAMARYFIMFGNFESSDNLPLRYASFTVENIISTADADIASGSTQLRLRFGHDTGLMPLLAFLDVNGFGGRTASALEGIEIYPVYNVPMGCSVQFVFFRNASGDVIFKLLLNEAEATLPLQAVSGPYYRWTDFKEHYLPLIAAAKESIQRQLENPLETLKAVDWGWRPLEGSLVEVGSATVPVFGSMQTVTMLRFPQRKQRVSVFESDCENAAITSELGAKSGALGAINGSYFNVTTLEPMTFVKDEGKVVFGQLTDNPLRCNGVFRIRNRKGSRVDILTVDTLNFAKAAKGWREAIMAGPVLIEDGSLPKYTDSDIDPRYFKKFYSKRHPRTALGYTQDGWIYLIAVDGRFPGQAEGMTIDEMQVLCQSLGLYEALNLDGGGSTTLWVKGEGVLNHPYDNKVFDSLGERIVPNIITVR